MPRLGFANNYGLAMRADRARELDVDSISDLIAQAGDLTLGIEADFQIRPLDGLQPLPARYGMEFGALDVVPLDERGVIYDKLLDADRKSPRLNSSHLCATRMTSTACNKKFSTHRH